MAKEIKQPDYIFETSWEVCNKEVGLHTVIASKAQELTKRLSSNYILIGPDVWRDFDDNPEFTEDTQLFSAWKKSIQNEGIRVRTGRWNIPGNPLAIIVDFTVFMGKKDEIFAGFWERYKLDSLSGQWDYIEPALFGYAAGKVIESFTKFYYTPGEKVLAQFHEWKTGAGILYLNDQVPQVATVYTAHDTVAGQLIAAYKGDLYTNIEKYDAMEVAKEFNEFAKQSMEKIAANTADCLTAVSELCAEECRCFLRRTPDQITPDGIDELYLPTKDESREKRKKAKNKLKQVTDILVGEQISDDHLFVAISGKYEMRNNGIDVFLNVMKHYAEQDNDTPVVAFVLIPAEHNGPRNDLQKHLVEGTLPDEPLSDKYLTHYLNDPENDPVKNMIQQLGFKNQTGDKVKVVYLPEYLNGNDGIIDMPYYELLAGFGLTVYPSLYDPWGVAAMESIAMGIPSVITSNTGFAKWLASNDLDLSQALSIVERDGANDDQVIKSISNLVGQAGAWNKKKRQEISGQAYEIAGNLQWNALIDNYFAVYNGAIQKLGERAHLFAEQKQTEATVHARKPMVNNPIWNKLVVQSSLPDKLKQLDEIAMNLWWVWNEDARALFEDIDRKLFEACDFNPLVLFERLDYKRLSELENDKEYLERLDTVHKKFKQYMDNKKDQKPSIAYFSMEYGLHNPLKIFSGGLGVLAGDYLKEASDSNVNIVGIGLLYRYGYFKQQISVTGDQISSNESQDFSKLPVVQVKNKAGNPLTVNIGLPGRTLIANIWKVNVGRIPLYLLDTDHKYNSQQDRDITRQLYGGDKENRLKQEILLGIGGIRALDTLGFKPDLYHSNEGHSAFIGLERLRKFIMEEKITFTEAKEIVRASTLFTTHTPVPAGHDLFHEDLLRTYFAHYPGRLKISWDEFFNLGTPEDEKRDMFNMSYLAANLSQEINAVSRLHGKVTCEMFAEMWKGYLPEESHIKYVTNGVHLSTWTSPEWQELYQKKLGVDFMDKHEDPKLWEKIYNVPDKLIWDTKNQHRKKLIDGLIERYHDNWLKRHEDPKQVIKVTEVLDENKLTIGFARRFATYKRANLLFKNLDRLSAIVNNEEQPVQFLFAGKAHPHDKPGQALLKNIVEISKRPEFLGKIVFLQNYDMALGEKLVQGVDIWLNTPTRPLEASGTSGQKAVMNGGMHFSVLDGWWAEGYIEGAGWALPEERLYEDQQLQNEIDAETIYHILENDIVPMYYDRNDKDIPVEWVKYIKNSIAKVAPQFTMRRMINDYKESLYGPMWKRTSKLAGDNYKDAGKMVAWKKNILKNWNNIQVIELDLPVNETDIYTVDNEFDAKVVLDVAELKPNDIWVEVVFIDNNGKYINSQELKQVKADKSKVTYHAVINPALPGTLQFGVRMFPKNNKMAYRQDFSVVRWI